MDICWSVCHYSCEYGKNIFGHVGGGCYSTTIFAADRGTKTALIMNVHWQLHQQRTLTIEAEHTVMYGS